ncbi:phage tail protein I [uncultured Desulfovibrio sp.]|uniref:phage tail protein I n=1 Tax=uncultured Desulfovibrio sp. TaxID=167968 RepID=UPI00272C379D|nr:phage tail protein I [uncultured Desulfovibrio sp.]
MSRYLGSTPFRELLAPSIARDPSVRAAAAALDNVLNAAARAVPDVLVYARLAHDTGFVDPVPMLPPLTRLSDLSGGLAELPPEALDLLAWQLHVEGYEAAVSVQAKRELVSVSLILHRRKGTPWAVRNALEIALRLPAEVRQWFEYGGKPYFFRVRLDVTGAVFGPESGHNAFRLIHDHKNVRSWLDCLETEAAIPLPESVGVGLADHTATRLLLRFPPPPSSPLRQRIGLCAAHATSARLRCCSPPRPAPSLSASPRMALRAVTRFRLAVPGSGGRYVR